MLPTNRHGVNGVAGVRDNVLIPFLSEIHFFIHFLAELYRQAVQIINIESCPNNVSDQHQWWPDMI